VLVVGNMPLFRFIHILGMLSFFKTLFSATARGPKNCGALGYNVVAWWPGPYNPALHSLYSHLFALISLVDSVFFSATADS